MAPLKKFTELQKSSECSSYCTVRFSPGSTLKVYFGICVQKSMESSVNQCSAWGKRTKKQKI